MENLNLENIKNKRVLVVGLGKSGIAAVQAMLKLGAIVSVQDSKEAAAVDGQLLTFLKGKGVECYFHEIPEHVEKFDMLILSPGVNPELDFIREAKAGGAEIIGELEIAYRIARGTFIAITGTNGKTTTTTLVGEIFKNARRKTIRQAIGNSCNPALAKVASLLGKTRFYKYLDLYGITDKTGVDYPGEAGAIIQSLENVGPVELATIGYGQGISGLCHR